MSGFLAAGLFTSSIAFLICASMSSSWAKPGVIVKSARVAEKSRGFIMISEARETLGKEKHDLAKAVLQRTHSRSAAKRFAIAGLKPLRKQQSYRAMMTSFELRLARRMARLGTETAFEVLVKARALEAKR